MKFFARCFLILFLTTSLPLSAQEPQEEIYSVAVLGGGVGALTSAIYLSRAGLEPIVIEGASPGGLLTQSHTVQNWPGEMEIAGGNLTEKIREQAKANGARLLSEEVVAIDFAKRPLVITTRSLDGKETVRQIRAQSCIIAMGTEPNFLGIPGEKQYWGHGVTNCAVCDGALYQGRVVGVVGGGDAAILESLYLSDLAKEVHLFVRKDRFKAVEEKRVQTLLAKSNVHVHYNAAVQEVKGDGEKVTGVKLATKEIPLDGLFLAIGSKPNSALFQDVLKLDEKGYIQLQKDQLTSMDGVFAIGDIVDPVYKQAISAAGDGAKAALQAQQYLSDSGKIVVRSPLKKEEALVHGEVIEIASVDQFEKELKTDTPVVVDFYATWCGPCKRISPLLESSADHLSGKVKFLKVNVDQFYDLSRLYEIRAMPTVLVFDPSGKVLERKVGSEQIADLLNRLEADSSSLESKISL